MQTEVLIATGINKFVVVNNVVFIQFITAWIHIPNMDNLAILHRVDVIIFSYEFNWFVMIPNTFLIGNFDSLDNTIVINNFNHLRLKTLNFLMWAYLP